MNVSSDEEPDETTGLMTSSAVPRDYERGGEEEDARARQERLSKDMANPEVPPAVPPAVGAGDNSSNPSSDNTTVTSVNSTNPDGSYVDIRSPNADRVSWCEFFIVDECNRIIDV